MRESALLFVPTSDHSLIEALLEAGADKSARNSLGDTPRDDAVTFDQREVVHLL